MSKPTIPIDFYLEAASVFHWATKRHYQLWFTGQARTRHRRTESVLRRLTKSGKLRAVYYGKKLIYSIPRISKGTKNDEFSGLSKVVHGLACTECLVRFFRSRTDGTVIAECYFSGLGAVPEWGIVYPNGNMLLFEFCTKHNFFFSGNVQGKLSAYRQNLEKIEDKFNAKAMVVFVIDVPRITLEKYIISRAYAGSASAEGDTFPFNPFFFTDYETFLNVPIGQALYEPIYIWSDGKNYPLTNNVRSENH